MYSNDIAQKLFFMEIKGQNSDDDERILSIIELDLYFMIIYQDMKYESNTPKGAQWLIGRVLDSRPKGCGLEPHRRHCVVVLEQDTLILA